MRDTDPLYCLADMLEYLDGLQRSSGRIDEARAGLDYLKGRGFSIIHKAGPPTIRGTTPEELKAARKALRLTNQRLADEAGISINAVINAQSKGNSVRRRTIDAMVTALVKLGANAPNVTANDA